MFKEKIINKNNSKYEKDIDPINQPLKSLCSFKRVSVKKGESQKIKINIPYYCLTTVTEEGERVFLKGVYKFIIGNKEKEIELI